MISEPDTVSERDFACPAKRRRQSEIDDEVVLRRAALNDDYKYRIDLLDQPASDAVAKRFNECYHDIFFHLIKYQLLYIYTKVHIYLFVFGIIENQVLHRYGEL